MSRTVSVNWPMPAAQRLKTHNRPATTGNCGTRMRLMTPTRKKLPLASWRTSSHNSEAWRSGRIRVACMNQSIELMVLVERFFGGTDRVLHQHRNGHRTDAAGVRGDFPGNFLDGDKINVA